MYLFIAGFILSTMIGVYSYKKEALTVSGVVGAILTGTIIFGFGGKPSWYLLLILFFISSSLLSFYRRKEKDVISDIFEKTGKRDIWQALANAGFASILAILAFYLQGDWIYIAFATSFATVNADTWATELGVLSKGKPRSILSGKIVEKGTSGGISLLGFIGSVLGSLLIGVSAFFLQLLEGRELDEVMVISLLFIIPIAGMLGGLIDSFLGATIQVMYKCQVCHKETEKNLHCNVPSKQFRGIKWMNNDMVNLLSSVISSGIAVILYFVLV